MALGRISGPLLNANLLRNGVDLAFENDLLFLDVTGKFVGINKGEFSSPVYGLDVGDPTNPTQTLAQGTIRALAVKGGIITVDNVIIDDTGITTEIGNLTLSTALTSGNIVSQRNLIPSQTDTYSLGDINFRWANGVFQSVDVGNVTIDDSTVSTSTGNLILRGASASDRLYLVDPTVQGDLLPETDNLQKIGNSTLKWSEGHFNNLFVETNIVFGDGSPVYATNEIDKVYVQLNGDDLTGDGTGLAFAYRTIKHALSQAVSGQSVVISPGIYQEEFPLVVPQGVQVIGAGLRSTTIVPTLSTNNKDCFLLGGETTVQDLTVRDMFYDSVNNTGYAFRFAPNCIVTSRSPYIQRVTVLNKGSNPTPTDPYGFASADAGRGALLDGASVTRSSLEAAILFNEVTFIVPNSRALIMTNGARTEWLTCFTYFADLAIEGLVGTQGRGGDGKTYIELANVTGTFAEGDTLTLYEDDGVTVKASGVIEDIVGTRYVLDGSVSGFLTNTDRANKPITVFGDAQLSTLEKKFGASSLLLDGTGDYISIGSSNDFAFGTDDFTIEFWFYRIGDSLTQILYDQRTATPQVKPLIFINPSNQIIYNINGNARITGTTVSANSWNHVAVSRSGTSTKMFLNGAQIGSTYTDTNNYEVSPIYIGARWDGTTAFNGYLDEIRVTKGLARYTANFTPSTTAFNGDSSTVLLLHMDGANGSTLILDDGITTQDIRSTSSGTATGIVRYDRAEFAAEMRSISSANVYGNQGVKADGVDVTIQLMAHNFAYIGTQADLTNNKRAVVQANEVIEINDGKVYYNSVDQVGNYRVGNLFSVNFETGAVSFAAPAFNIESLTGITFTDGTNTTIVNPSGIETGNLVIAGNTISSVSGNIILDPNSSSTLIVNSPTQINGNVDIDSTGFLKLPVGDTSQRVDPAEVGQIRYNSQISSFEGYGSGGWASLGGVKSVDGLTYIVAETSAGASNDELEFYAAIDDLTTSKVGGWNQTRLLINTDAEIVGNLTIGGNIILGNQPIDTITVTADFTSDLIPATNNTYDLGTSTESWRTIYVSQTSVGTLEITDSGLTQTAVDGSITLTPNGFGTIVIDTTTALQLPVGTTAERPTVAVTGEVRFNTDENRVENFDGTAWNRMIHEDDAISFAIALG
jgi:hypothetical protein